MREDGNEAEDSIQNETNQFLANYVGIFVKLLNVANYIAVLGL